MLFYLGCEILTNIDNGTMLVTAGVEGNWSFGSFVKYNCNTGYNLTFDLPMMCLGNGSWNGSQPVCKLVTCSPPIMPVNGSYAPINTTYNYTDIVEFSCLLGFDRLGPNTSYCGATGQWSEYSPVCQIKDCHDLATPANGKVQLTAGTTFGQSAYYSCLEGYALNGTGTRTCNASGKWTPEAPTCDLRRKLCIDNLYRFKCG